MPLSVLTRLRRGIRALVPYELRLQFRLLRRHLRDRLDGTVFTEQRADEQAYPWRWSEHTAPLRIYSGQERSAAAKRHNIALFAASLDGLIIARGSTLSLWYAAGRPSARHGYAEAAAIRDGRLIEEPGGAVCLPSSAIYHAAVEAGLTVVERRAHSLDTYGPDRYFTLGLDATIEYGYIDLRLRNDGYASLRLGVELLGDTLTAAFSAAAPSSVRIHVEVTPPRRSVSEISVETRRCTVEAGKPTRRESLGVSRYRLPPHTDESPDA